MTTQLGIPLLRNEGKGNEELINIYDKWIYFYNDTLQGIYKMNLKTKDKIQLLDCKYDIIPIQLRLTKSQLFFCYKGLDIAADPIPIYTHFQDRYIGYISITNKTSSSDFKPISKGKDLTTYNDYVFFLGYDNYGIYRVNSDGTNITKIVNDDIIFNDNEQPYKITNGKLTYESISIYNKKNNNSISNNRPTGDLQTKTNSYYPYSMYEKGGWIYYINSVNNLIYKVRTDGTEEQKLMESRDGFTDLQLYDNYLIAYCTYTLDLNSLYPEREVYGISTDDGKVLKLPGISNRFIAGVKDWIIYEKDFEGLYKIKRDGTGLSKLNINLKYICSSKENCLYYLENNPIGEKYNLMKMSLDTNEVTQVTTVDKSYFDENGFSKIFYASEPWIYYTDEGKASHAIYKLNINNNEKIKLYEDQKMALMVLEADNDWIYFSKGKVFKLNINKPNDIYEVSSSQNQEFDTKVEIFEIDLNK